VDPIRIKGEEHLIAAKAAGKGAVLPLAHSGNWDHAGAWLALTHGRLVTVAERLRPEGLYRKFLAYRNALGMEILPLGEPAIVRDLLRALRENAFVPLLADRDLSHNGVEVLIFGEATKIPPGPAVLAVMSGSPLLPASLYYEGETLVTEIHAPISVPAMGTRADKVAALSQSYIDVIAIGIAAHPEDWHMMQPLWLSDLSPRKISP
jgi:KDO2-lipid IV(A) lauroyltransferase